VGSEDENKKMISTSICIFKKEKGRYKETNRSSIALSGELTMWFGNNQIMIIDKDKFSIVSFPLLEVISEVKLRVPFIPSVSSISDGIICSLANGKVSLWQLNDSSYIRSISAIQSNPCFLKSFPAKLITAGKDYSLVIWRFAVFPVSIDKERASAILDKRLKSIISEPDVVSAHELAQKILFKIPIESAESLEEFSDIFWEKCIAYKNIMPILIQLERILPQFIPKTKAETTYKDPIISLKILFEQKVEEALIQNRFNGIRQFFDSFFMTQEFIYHLAENYETNITANTIRAAKFLLTKLDNILTSGCKKKLEAVAEQSNSCVLQ